jgi:4-amino-4-deoxy-L-arabinose transferase-like glycosyltransferase
MAGPMSRTRLALILIFVLALGVRVGYYESNPRPVVGTWWWGWMAHFIVDDGHWFQLNDHASYVTLAGPVRTNQRMLQPADVKHLKAADANPKWTPFVAEPVGEALVLAGLWELTGSERYLPDAILRIVLDAFTTLLIYRISMRLFKRRRGALLAAGLYGLYPPIAWITSFPVLDVWGVDFTIAIVAAYLEAVNSASHRSRWLIACGLLAGMGAYFRPGVLILPAVLALVTIPDTGWRGALRQGLAMTAIALLLLIPWTIRNYRAFHAFTPTRTGNGQVLWEGLGELPNSFGAKNSDYTTYQEVHRVRPDLHYQSPAFDAYLQHKAVRTIEQRPLFYLKLVARRAALATIWTFNTEWMHGGSTSPSAYGHGWLSFALHRPFNLLEVMLQPLVFLLAMLALAFTWSRRARAHAILIATTLAVIVPYVLLYLEFRYVLPAAFAYFIWIGLGADLLLARLGQWREQTVSHRRRGESLVVAHHALPASAQHRGQRQP